MNDCAYQPGDLLMGKYQVIRVLGGGNMGTVLLARHVALDQPVAIKALAAPHTASEMQQRFLREARASVRLRSEHAVKVLDIVMEGTSPYIVMEFLEGHDLAAELQQRGPLPVEEAVEHVLQASEAIGEAHAAGIVHRDIKPANLFLTLGAGGRRIVKVCDFGIAKVEGDVALTGEAKALGSPLYMAPEQLRSAREADARSDIWALGVVLYELLAGRTPFLGENITEVFARIALDQPAPVTSWRPDVPPGLGSVIAVCLEKDRARRFPNVAALAAALAPYAPERAKVYVERTAAVVGTSVELSRPTAVLPVQAAAAPAVPAPTRLPAVPRRRGWAAALAAIGVALALAGSVALAVTWARRSRPAPARSETPMPALSPAMSAAPAACAAPAALTAPGGVDAGVAPPASAAKAPSPPRPQPPDAPARRRPATSPKSVGSVYDM